MLLCRAPRLRGCGHVLPGDAPFGTLLRSVVRRLCRLTTRQPASAPETPIPSSFWRLFGWHDDCSPCYRDAFLTSTGEHGHAQ
jgi:hypothetical protein